MLAPVLVSYIIVNCMTLCLFDLTSLGVFQEMIEQYVHWNEDIGEWQLKCVAYTGNNMRKQTPQPEKDKEKQVCKQGTFHKYRRNVNVNPRGGGTPMEF